MTYDSWRRPSWPHTTFPQTRAYGSARPATTSRQSLDRTERSGLWFTLRRHGGNVILNHRRIQPVLIRERFAQGCRNRLIWRTGPLACAGSPGETSLLTASGPWPLPC